MPRLYLDAGADCVYPITVSDEETARALGGRDAGRPVNLLARPEAADVARLRLRGGPHQRGSGLARLADQRAERGRLDAGRRPSRPLRT